MRTAFFVVTAYAGLAVFLGLAVYVVTRNPRRPISWVFGAFCFTIASYYLTSLFLLPKPNLLTAVPPLVLRWKWAAIALSPAFYLHLMSFYFPPAWRKHQSWGLPLAYLVNTGLALAALFTDFLVAGSLQRPSLYIIGPIPGPLMYVLTGLFVVEVASGTAGLIAGYQAAHSPSLRRQILYLLTPAGLTILSSVAAWTIVLTKDTGRIPPELVTIPLIAAAIFYVRAVLGYGSFVGRPLARRDVVYSILSVTFGLIALYLTVTLDSWLNTFTPFSYPIITGILVIILAASFPVVSRWGMRQLDRWFFPTQRKRRETIRQMTAELAKAPDIGQLQTELLGMLCSKVGVRGGYVALSDPDSSSGALTVSAVRGNIPVRVGDAVELPLLRGREPQLVAALLPQKQEEPGLQGVALLCSLITDQGPGGVLALGEKRDESPFICQELTLCTELIRQGDIIVQIMCLYEQRNRHLEVARLRDQALQELKRETIAALYETLTVREPGAAPIGIRVLGPLQVYRHGQLIPETEWITGKAKGVLAYLLWRGSTGATREEMSEVLWPDHLVEEAANVFHVTLHRLRRVLEPELRQARDSKYIVYERGRYCFNVEAPHWLDVAEFEALIAEGTLTAFKKAVALYQGAYLEDVDWASLAEVGARQRRLELLYADTLRRLAAQADEREAALYLEKLLAVEPVDETAQRALVLSYLAQGRHDLARRQVVRWQQALEELGAEPSPEAAAVWQRVKAKSHRQI